MLIYVGGGIKDFQLKNCSKYVDIFHLTVHLTVKMMDRLIAQGNTNPNIITKRLVF